MDNLKIIILAGVPTIGLAVFFLGLISEDKGKCRMPRYENPPPPPDKRPNTTSSLETFTKAEKDECS